MPSDECSGKVVGYEMQVVCPECGYHTDPLGREASVSEPLICGEDVPNSDNHGCGRELAVDVQVSGSDDTPTTIRHEPDGDVMESINEFAVVGEFGFQRVHGPFSVVRSGTSWAIVVPEDTHPTVSTLPDQEGEAAAIVADGEIVGGGIITQVVQDSENDEIHVTVDQYAQSDPDV